MSYYVYFIVGGSLVKIGLSCNVERRLKELQTSNPTKLTLAHKIQTSSEAQAYFLENQLHKRYEKLRQRGEWFKGLSIVRAVRKAEKLLEWHNEAVEKDKNILLNRLRDLVPPSVYIQFFEESAKLGATQYCFDVTNYEYGRKPCTVYAFKGQGKRKRRAFLMALSPQGIFRARSNTAFSEEGRKFSQIDKGRI